MGDVLYLPGSEPGRSEEPRLVRGDDPYPVSGQIPAPPTGPIALPEPGEARKAEDISMAALTRRGVSKRELATMLADRGLDPEVIEGELARLERVGLIDDAALAETLVRVLQERKGLGRMGLTAELRRRGIETMTIESALSGLDDADERERAFALADRRSRGLAGFDRETAERRLSAYLLRKGYPGGVTRDAVRAALDGAGVSDDPVRFR